MLTCGPMSAKRKSAEDEAVDHDAMPTKIKKILQRYRDLYHEIWPTLRRSQRGEYYVRCTTGSTDFSCSHARKNYRKRHIESKTYKELSALQKSNRSMSSALQKSNRSMSSFLTKSSTETHNQRAVTRAKVLMCELIAE